MNNFPYKLLYAREQISARVREMGKEIDKWCKDVQNETKKDVLAVPLLQGGIFIFADLIREIDSSIEFAMAATTAYQIGDNGLPSARNVEVSIDDVSPKDRSVLIIDDICDSGRTLKAVCSAVREKGARDVRSAVLIKRNIPEVADNFTPDYIGFHHAGTEWFVGYGLDDDANRYRNLPYVGMVRP